MRAFAHAKWMRASVRGGFSRRDRVGVARIIPRGHAMYGRRVSLMMCVVQNTEHFMLYGVCWNGAPGSARASPGCHRRPRNTRSPLPPFVHRGRATAQRQPEVNRAADRAEGSRHAWTDSSRRPPAPPVHRRRRCSSNCSDGEIDEPDSSRKERRTSVSEESADDVQS
ncbi:hypothetical protein MRX96_055201 [Rhipicephalus microplus]